MVGTVQISITNTKNQAKNLNHLNYHNQAARKHKTETSQYQSENASDQEEQDEGEKISLYLKLGKYKNLNLCDFVF